MNVVGDMKNKKPDILTVPNHIAEDPTKLNKFIEAFGCPKCGSSGIFEISTADKDLGKFQCQYCNHIIRLIPTPQPMLFNMKNFCALILQSLLIGLFKPSTKKKIFVTCLFFLFSMMLFLPIMCN